MLSIKRCRAKTRKPESFLSKLFDILNNTNNNSAISWDSEGKKIVISDIVKLCNEVLPKFYKHKNYSSFIRQLNLYGFHKTRGILDNSEKCLKKMRFLIQIISLFKILKLMKIYQ